MRNKNAGMTDGRTDGWTLCDYVRKREERSEEGDTTASKNSTLATYVHTKAGD